MPAIPIMGRGNPGAGAYDPMDAVDQVKSRKDFNQAKHSAAFAANVVSAAVNAQVAAAREVPGPGHYPRAGAPSASAHVNAAQAAFRSLSRRNDTGGTGGDTEEKPGPGAYNTESAPQLPSESEVCNAVFKEPTQRRIVPVHRDLPAADKKAREALGEFADVTSRECQGLARRYPLPGPGHYDQDRDGMWEGNLVAAGGSSSFQLGPHRSDVAAASSEAPGPGRYDMPACAMDKLTSAVSSFVTKTERNKLLLRDAPGPAYYAPKAPKLATKKSFLLNPAREWVGSV